MDDGRRFLGRYELLYLLGQGGMGEVHLARLTGAAGFEKLCIVKTILPQMMREPQFVDRFRHEAKILVQLNHSNIAQVYDMGDVEGTLYMAIEYVAGVDLARVQDRAKGASAHIPVPIALEIGKELCEALAYAHRKQGPDGHRLGIVHRDVSPHNVMVSYEGEVKVIDFGLAKSAARSRATLPSTVLGKLGYMSPEQARAQVVDHRSDIYSAGIVLWELLAGRPAFTGGSVAEMVAQMSSPSIPTLASIRPEVSADLERVVHRALAVDAAGRYGRCEELANALEQFQHREGLVVRSEAVGEYVRSMCSQEYTAERRLQSKLSAARTEAEAPPKVEVPGTAIRTTPRPEASRPDSTEPMPSTPPSPSGAHGRARPSESSLQVLPARRRWLVPALVLIGGGGLAVAAAVVGDTLWRRPSAEPPSASTVLDASLPAQALIAEARVAAADAGPREEAATGRALVEVRGPLFPVIRKGDELYVPVAGGKPKLRVGDAVRVVGEEVSGKRPSFADASVFQLHGTFARLLVEDVGALPEKGLFGVVEQRHVASGSPKDAGGAAFAEGRAERPAGSPPRRVELGAAPAEAWALPPAADDSSATAAVPAAPPAAVAAVTPPRVIRGSVVMSGRERPVVVVKNGNDFPWTGCDLRLPFAAHFQYQPEAAVAAGGEDRLDYARFVRDERPPLNYFKDGYAAVSCREGLGYLKFSRTK